MDNFTSVIDIRMHRKWWKRTLQNHHRTRVAFMIALAAVAVSAAIVFVAHQLEATWWLPLDELASEGIWILLFAVGGWAIARTSIWRLPFYLLWVLGAVVVLLILSTVAYTLFEPSDSYAYVGFVFVSSVLAVTVFVGTGILAVRDCLGSPFCRISLQHWREALMYGIGAGTLIMLQRVLAARWGQVFAVDVPFNFLLILQRLVVIVFLQAIAEELVFRGTIFEHLYNTRRLRLWLAICVATALNLLIYLPQVPTGVNAVQAALMLLGPAMLAVTNALLWTWERGPISSVTSNLTFRILCLFWG